MKQTLFTIIISLHLCAIALAERLTLRLHNMSFHEDIFEHSHLLMVSIKGDILSNPTYQSTTVYKLDVPKSGGHHEMTVPITDMFITTIKLSLHSIVPMIIAKPVLEKLDKDNSFNSYNNVISSLDDAHSAAFYYLSSPHYHVIDLSITDNANSLDNLDMEITFELDSSGHKLAVTPIFNGSSIADSNTYVFDSLSAYREEEIG